MVKFAFGIGLAAAMTGSLLIGTSAQASPKLLLDLKSGKVLYAEDATQPWYPASLSKLMTAYVVLKAMQAGRIDGGTPVAISRRASREVPSKMGYPVGTKVTVDDALKMLIVQSANDIAIALAEGTSGSVEAFAGEMNRYSRQLGMAQSYWDNPNGLPDPQQVSSARDLAIVSMALLRDFPQYAELFQIQQIRSGKRVMRSHNAMLYRYPGTMGMKTGFTCAAGFNVIVRVNRGGRDLLAVVLGAPSAKERTQITADLIENNANAGRGFTGLFSSGSTLDRLPPPQIRTPVDNRAVACNPRRGDTTAEEAPKVAPDGTVAAFAAAPASPLLASWTLTPPVVVGPYLGPKPSANVIPASELVAEKPAKAVKGKAKAAKKQASKPAKAKKKPAKAKARTAKTGAAH